MARIVYERADVNPLIADAWFEQQVFVPLREQEPRAAIQGM